MTEIALGIGIASVSFALGAWLGVKICLKRYALLGVATPQQIEERQRKKGIPSGPPWAR